MPFSRVIGQDVPVDILRRALRSGRMAHAYIFEGIEGCGRETTALAFVEAVFCGSDDGCGNCPSCRKMAGLQHPDLHIVEPDGTFIKIDQIRGLQHELALRPVEAPLKACIIRDADRLHPAAGNALLKTLEEPPGRALIILLTTNPAGVLPTIRSRCQMLRFAPLPERIIEEKLVAAGQDPAIARLTASLAGGSLGRAMDGGKFHSIDRKGLLDRLRSLSLGDSDQIFTLGEEMAASREEALEHLEILTSLLRDILIIHEGGDSVVNRDLMPMLEEEARRISRERSLERINHVIEAQRALMRNANPRLTLDVLLMRLTG